MGDITPTSLIKKRHTFGITCATFAAIGFAELMALGVAIALRTGETRIVEKIIPGDPIIVSIPTVRAQPEIKEVEVAGDGASISEKYAGDFTPTIKDPNIPVHPPVSPQNRSGDPDHFTPQVDNAKVAEILREAHGLHINGDMMRAILKLEEAENIDPNEPAVYYQKAELFEDMGHWQKAGDNYQKLFDMGPEIGSYYAQASLKLSRGFGPERDIQGLMVLGNFIPRIAEDKLNAKLPIPVRALQDKDIDPDKVDIRVHIYDIVDGKKIEPVPPARAKNITTRWLNPPVDWKDQAEEVLECEYVIPPLAIADTHLFGNRKYFGHVIELYYKGELLDQQASPRRLHAIHAKQNQVPGMDLNWPSDFDLEEPLPNINPDNPLLPPLPRK
ncbi:hypothetical protein Rhal01_03248 [Rubritalea halochordaticola]|uniref:Tetratricopeptide repeat protein n=1 Tax=Rubritalea halochordaticola TaxID=714537 RepID=A0ABP9V510_9BACT